MPRKSRKNIGLIGLGIIGSRVAAGLREAGYKVYVWSRTPRPEPNFLGSPAKVAEICEVILIFVSDAEAVYETIERLSGSLTEHHIVVCCSTIGPTAVREAARRVEAQGACFVDAPFTGSKEAASSNQLVYYLGGTPELLERVEAVLGPVSKAIVRIGEVGHAATVKIALNMMVAVSAQTLAEALAVVRQSGVTQESFAEALAHNGARSVVTDLKLPKMLTREYDPHFSLKNMFKDVQLAIHMANAFDLDIPATTATAGVMYGGLNRGWGDQDFSVVTEMFPQPAIPEPEPEPKPEPKPEPEPAPAPLSAEGAENPTPASDEKAVEAPPITTEPVIEPTPALEPAPVAKAEAETPPPTSFEPPPTTPTPIPAEEAKESGTEKPRSLFGSLFGTKR